MSASHLPGALVLSLDFELRWGVRDHCPPGAPYERSLLGARAVVPQMLDLFRRYQIAATWATVGFLFARSREELLEFRPGILPHYEDSSLDPYGDAVGRDENDDPLHFAPSLIRKIVETPRQEIGTHTHSHYFCNEAGQTLESFRADLHAAIGIMSRWGIEPRSIVFPRNQVNPAYSASLREAGILAYRGNPVSWMWRFGDASESATIGRRIARAADTYLRVDSAETVDWADVPTEDGLADVRASLMLRPYVPGRRALEPLRLRRIRTAMREAAREGQIFHLWWHPHNFGAHPAGSLAFLEAVLREFDFCRTRHGMVSMTMAEVASTVLADSPNYVSQPEPIG